MNLIREIGLLAELTSREEVKLIAIAVVIGMIGEGFGWWS